MGNSSRESDRELLIPVADYVDHDDDVSSSSKPSPFASSSHLHSGREIVIPSTLFLGWEGGRTSLGEPSCGDTIALVNERLMKRACGRFIRLYMQIWMVLNVESMNGQQNVVLNHLDFAIQSLKVNVSPASTMAISFKLKDGNIIKWDRPKPGRRPDIFPQFSPMKTPLPPPMPADPPEEDEEEEEERKEEEEEDPEKPEQ
ncbi:Hypothetical predicted protein [Olea europaea subsp. europaea]|uniref:Uncharacterized protein n=1 Tax=Olea europaea subsp. europaea TaxID=158383 RepID=A0A8S0TBF2_OLEEU|nr:Hypothetical predicted protein [Olea europaea subsp. europaea]